MSLAEAVTSEELWNQLQQPARPSEMEPRFQLLLAAMDLGWEVEAPVYLRARWGEGGPRVYHFILRHDSFAVPRLITVPECSQVVHFVRREGLKVAVGA
jgi:hypothetical protein